jgi:signal transduction histidine kinase/CheY-like chemotaxis protein/ABC-type sugar transport system substrate-binding protein
VLAGWQAFAPTLSSFLGLVLDGIRAAATEDGCNLVLACGVGGLYDIHPGRPAWPILVPEADFCPVGHWNTDGLIAVEPLGPAIIAGYLEPLVAEGYPVVFAGAGEQGRDVIADNENGIYQALEHLVFHGHRRIAFVAGHRDRVQGDSGRRLRAYRSAMTEYGLDLDDRLIVYGSHTTAGGRQAMRRILGQGVPFTAVLASNDSSAIGVVEVLREAGLRVPQDVAVIGFDDLLEAGAQLPPLTTVHYPAFEEGYQSLKLLLDYIAGRVVEDVTVRVPTRLVIRESCGCLPGDALSVSLPARTTPEAKGAHSGPMDARSKVARAMAHAVSVAVHRLTWDEVYDLCHQMALSFLQSLKQGDASVFRLAVHGVLCRVTLSQDDLRIWRVAISVLRDSLPLLLDPDSPRPVQQQAGDLLHWASVAIGEAAWGRHARHRLGQAQVADRIGEMTAQFFAALDTDDIYDVLAQSLPEIGIQHVAVALYEAQDSDPVAWSVLQTPHERDDPLRFATRRFPPDGLYPEDRPFQLAVLPLLIQGTLSGFVALDASNLEPCADVVRQLAAALWEVRLYREAVEARQLAEEADRLKSHFLSIVSHELRTPLNLIAGLSDMLLQGGQQMASGKYLVDREDVERIYVNAQHLDGLIRDVLDLMRCELGTLRLAHERLDLAQVLATVSAMGAQLAEAKGLSWRAEVPPGLPLVWGDRTRLRQVTLNLVNNAVKFTTQGEVALSALANGDSVLVTVRDTGLGIPPVEQSLIFDEFHQSERTAARGYGGLGLGLAICRRLIEAHGGDIGVWSTGEEGAGSTFYYTLPTIEQAATYAPGEAGVPLRQQVRLLVRDVEGGTVLHDHLAQHGFQVAVSQVGDSPEWLTSLLAAPPSAVVLDRQLASEQGWEVLKRLEENPATRDVPVLFYTLEGKEDAGSLLEVAYLTKPVGSTELAEVLAYQGLLDRPDSEAAGSTVLIADDEPDILGMHTRIVEMHLPNCRVLQAQNGQEALDLVRDERPDLVLLDLMMPVLDGFGVLEAMQADENSRHIPVIVLTSQSLNEEDMSRLNRGVASVLGKGLFSVAETLKSVEAALARKRGLSTGTQRAVRKAMAYIHTHFAEPISLGHIASYVGLSERHLNRCFREELGVTVIVYLRRYRVRWAKALLERDDMLITDVALAVGFADSNYFARVFRREVGVSPRAYQQGVR